MTVSRNIPDTPKQLEHLASNDSFLEALTELLPVCLFAKDLEGRYIYVNEGFAAKTRIKDKSAIIGKKPSEVLAPAHAAVAEAEDRQVLNYAVTNKSQVLVDVIVDQAHAFAENIDDDVSLLLLKMEA